ncbi:alpha-2-macroglobulin family protein [Neolewinella persica]|uniref:alpha-2-macroglobulin family protein n=1 Tax=Neolewinella persica TaxID=70998 RepID=UPI0003783D04|nr:alpha-2-macroglobulin family protein [Neolewinella persica]
MRHLLLALLLALTTGLMSQDYKAEYDKMEAAQKDGKPRSALTAAEELFAKAARANDEDQMVKALAWRAAFTGQIEEDGADAAIKLLQQELAGNKDREVVTPILHFMLGSTYYRYAQQNSWRLRNATATTNDSLPANERPLADWNLQQLADAADQHLFKALELAEASRTELSTIPAIVTGDKERFVEQPTLYDLLAREAFTMLGSPLLSVSDPEVPNPEQYLGSAASFVQLPLDMDSSTGTYRKLKILQSLTNFHLGPPSPALLDVNVMRLQYIRQFGIPDTAYAAAFSRMHENFSATPGGDYLLVLEAEIYANGSVENLGEKPKATALAMLEKIKDKSPFVANRAELLRRQIMAKTLQTQVQTVYGKTDNLLLSVSYRNLARVYHRLYEAPKLGPSDDFSRWNLKEEALKELLSKRPLERADFRLSENDDYENHQTETWLKQMPAGRYYLVTSDNKDFDQQKGMVAIADFQVSDLAVMRYFDNDQHFFEVVDRTTGAPRAGVTVELQRGNNRDRYTTFKTVTTGKDGRVANPNIDRSQLRMVLTDRANDDVFVTDPGYHRSYKNDRQRKYPLTPLFTDRSIYRPGQTVKVYGLTWEKDQDEMPKMLTNEKRTLKLMDPNYQEVGTVEISSDEYSRFNAEFKLPTGGLTGYFQIQTEGGSLRFRMEEYKRPRFEVMLEGPDYAVAGEETEVKGSAKLYAGPGLDGAKVNYRVFLEEVSYWWWGRNGGNDKELVASGETETDGQGDFTVKFTPEKRQQKGRKRFRFVIEADVADDTGETHDASTKVPLRSDKPVIALKPVEDVVDVSDSLTILAAGSDETLTISLKIIPVTKPGAAIKNRKWGFPDRPVLEPDDYAKRFPYMAGEETPELQEWPTNGTAIYSGNLNVKDGEAKLNLAASSWPVGHYRVEWAYPDGTAGEPATFAVLNVEKADLPPGMAYHLQVDERAPKVGQEISLTLISAVDLPNVHGRWSSRRGNKLVETSANRKAVFTYTPKESDRGGISLNVGFLRFNEDQGFGQRFNLGWDNKKLKIDYAVFRDKLRPGTPERWTLTVRNADGTPVAAAALATMYDKSLDQISNEGNWQFSPFPNFYGGGNFGSLLVDGANTGQGQSQFRWPNLPTVPSAPRLDLSPFGNYGRPIAYGYDEGIQPRASRTMKRSAPAPASMNDSPPELEEMVVANSAMAGGAPPPPPPPPPGAPAPEETKAEEAPVQIRKNLQETAFWMPELTSDAEGNLVISFDSPEALTSWKFRLFAHDKELATAISEQTIVTQKELMILPNVPRFVREGDAMGLTARVNNMTEQEMDVQVSLELFNPATGEAFSDAVLSSLSGGGAAGAKGWRREQGIPASSGEAFSFPLTIPEGLSSQGPIGYRMIARSGSFSDGEENVIPVLTDRTLITVSQPFYLKRKDKKTVELPLLASTDSKTLRHVGYTFEATTNPAWLALKSLPYLMEYPYDCTEQLANRYFANQLAYVTVSRKPILEQVFRQWEQDPNALKSELEQNPTLKNALLTETPWLREAQSEAAQRARIGELFDLKRLANEQNEALAKLANRQDQNGYFSWFPGGRENRYMTQYVVETMARLQQLAAVTPDQEDILLDISTRAIAWLDQQMAEDYAKLKHDMRDKKDWEKDYRPSSSVVHFIYARSQSTWVIDPNKEAQAALDFYTERASASWLSYGLYEQALLAISQATPQQAARPQSEVTKKIIESLREKALRKDEFGMYWKYGQGYTWQQLPIETHCRILEAFQVAGGTTEELDEMRLWLLTNKRTNRWETTKSTAAAVFALLNTGTNWTDAPGRPLEVNWPKSGLKSDLASRARAAQETPEAATGAFSISVAGDQIDSGLATVKMKNKDNRLVWGGVYWQYTELAQKVEAANDGPLTLERELFRRIPTDDGIRLEPITADKPLNPGDRVTVRLILRSDRSLDYVHLKDRRAATFEPITQTSGYQYSSGLGYYFAPGDLATNFFIDHLPKGTYTLEYDLFTTYAGSFSNGLGRVQCMYAPEFGANTGGARIVVE